tara:strand:- start:80 stop:400 length:321 start_codon:yes stop_codon:yes gene_type:complete
MPDLMKIKDTLLNAIVDAKRLIPDKKVDFIKFYISDPTDEEMVEWTVLHEFTYERQLDGLKMWISVQYAGELYMDKELGRKVPRPKNQIHIMESTRSPELDTANVI